MKAFWLPFGWRLIVYRPSRRLVERLLERVGGKLVE